MLQGLVERGQEERRGGVGQSQSRDAWSGQVLGFACEVCRTEIRASRGKWKGVANGEWSKSPVQRLVWAEAWHAGLWCPASKSHLRNHDREAFSRLLRPVALGFGSRSPPKSRPERQKPRCPDTANRAEPRLRCAVTRASAEHYPPMWHSSGPEVCRNRGQC
jgi:hypothetical protein